MKNLFYLLAIMVLLMSGCKNSNVKTPAYAHGNAGDILVVMNNERWNSESGDTMRAIFHKEIIGVPMEEPMFDLHQIPIQKFVDINMRHKNIIFQEINPDAEETTIKLVKNKYAINQIFVHAIAKSQAEFVQLMSNNQNKLINLFLESDRDRWIEQYSRNLNKTDAEKIKNKYNISIKLPKSYYMDVCEDNFAWLTNSTKKYDMHILIYTYPITDSTRISPEFLIKKRNEIGEKYIPGENPGSHMSTEVKFDYPFLETIEHKNTPTAVMRGLWKVKGDFMGGSFISYTKLDEARNRVVTVEGFVYYPNEELRDKIRQLEGILYTFDLIK
jgi:hypothetical protein